MIKSILLASLSIALSDILCAQYISNVEAKCIGNNMVISYTLEFDIPILISLFCSEDNGVTWDGPLESVSGDVGAGITSGQKQITWDVLKDRDILSAEKIIFKVQAMSSGCFKDPRDGRIYKTKQFGNLRWMAENLNYTSPFGSWSYNNDSTYSVKYGRLYEWKIALVVCPSGWHLPTGTEWTSLLTQLGGVHFAGGKLKSVTGWKYPNSGATNESNLNFLPGGYRDLYGRYISAGIIGCFWSSSMSRGAFCYNINLYYNNERANLSSSQYKKGLSVRCVQ